MEKVATITSRIRHLVDGLSDLCSTEREKVMRQMVLPGQDIESAGLCCPDYSTAVQNIVQVVNIMLLYVFKYKSQKDGRIFWAPSTPPALTDTFVCSIYFNLGKFGCLLKLCLS